MARVIKTLEYSIADVVPYINWLYFFHAWGLSGKPDSEKNALREEAMQMLASMESRYATHMPCSDCLMPTPMATTSL